MIGVNVHSLKRCFGPITYKLVCVAVFLICMASCGDKKNIMDQYQWIVYKSAYNVQIEKHEDYHLIQISYLVKSPYPSKEIFNWLNEKLLKSGWNQYRPSELKNSYGNWENFQEVDKPNLKVKCIYQLLAKWIDAKRKLTIFLVLRFSSDLGDKNYCKPNPDKDIQSVYIQVLNGVEPQFKPN